MNYSEMSALVDVLYNNITSNQAPGLSEYEKSVFLTKAQDEKLKNHFEPNSNKLQKGFDDSPKRQMDFSSITKTFTQTTAGNFQAALFDTRSNSKSTALPSDAWIIINEKVTVTRNGSPVELTVVPITFTEYDDLMSKPYKRPLLYQAWRLVNVDNGRKADLIVGPGDVISGYKVRYVKRPHPIIIGNIDSLTIDGYTWGGPTTPGSPAANTVYGDNVCELDPIMHEEIVQRAVELAKVAWTNTGQDNLQAVLAAGQRSE